MDSQDSTITILYTTLTSYEICTTLISPIILFSFQFCIIFAKN